MKRSLCMILGCDKDHAAGGLCQMHRWRLRKFGNVHHKTARKLCRVLACERVTKGHGLCALHLDRQNNGLPLNYTRPVLAKKRYRVVNRPGHPLAFSNGRVYEHRMVLFDCVAGSPLPCFWCGQPLEWNKDLCVDHLNHDRQCNTPQNLVPACNGCNAGRTRHNPRIRVSAYSPGLAA